MFFIVMVDTEGVTHIRRRRGGGGGSLNLTFSEDVEGEGYLKI